MPFGNSIRSTCGFTFVHLRLRSAATSISLSKWPILPTIAMSFICAHVVDADVTSFLAGRGDEDVGRGRRRPRACTTSKPSIAACSAQIADRLPVTLTRAPAPGERSRRTLAHVAVAADDGNLAGHHHVGGAADAVEPAIPCSRTCCRTSTWWTRIVDVDRREGQQALLG